MTYTWLILVTRRWNRYGSQNRFLPTAAVASIRTTTSETSMEFLCKLQSHLDERAAANSNTLHSILQTLQATNAIYHPFRTK
jgi:hypothetical protein